MKKRSKKSLEDDQSFCEMENVMTQIRIPQKEVIKRRPKILLLITNLDYGGAQRVFHYLSEMMSHDFEVLECVFNLDNAVAFPGSNKLVNLDVRAGKNVVDKFLRFWQRVSRLKKLKKQHGIDICISHLEGADLVNVFSRTGEKTISWVHGSKRYDRNISGILGFIRHRFLIPYIYSRIDLTIAVSGAIKTELVEYYRANASMVTTVYNFFDIKLIQAKSGLPLPDGYEVVFSGSPVLLFSGRLALQKNLDGLIRWFASFSKVNDSNLVILGDGELRNELVTLCDQLKIKAFNPWSPMSLDDSYRIYFLGFQTNPYPFVKRADIFVLPSLWEGFPMVLGEAMACGVTIVSADCPTGPREMLCEKPNSDPLKFPYFGDYGVLLPLLNEQGIDLWSEGVRKLLCDKSIMENYSKQSLRRSNFFDLNRNTSLVIQLVKGLVHEKTY